MRGSEKRRRDRELQLARTIFEIRDGALQRIVAARISQMLEQRDHEAALHEVRRELAIRPRRAAVSVRDRDQRKVLAFDRTVRRDVHLIRSARHAARPSSDT